LKKRSPRKDPLEYKLDENGLKVLIHQLQSEINEYECLNNPNHTSMTWDCEIQDLPELLIKARLVRNMSQTDLGGLIGVKEQQIQRYEANGYDGVGFARLLEIQYALKLEISCKASILNNDIFELPNDIDEEEIVEKERRIREQSLFKASL
jgi:transcriptional regulator with XRE-family HTH domain